MWRLGNEIVQAVKNQHRHFKPYTHLGIGGRRNESTVSKPDYFSRGFQSSLQKSGTSPIQHGFQTSNTTLELRIEAFEVPGSLQVIYQDGNRNHPALTR